MFQRTRTVVRTHAGSKPVFVLAMAVCMIAALALPGIASAAPTAIVGSPYPGSGTYQSVPTVGAVFQGGSTALNLSSAWMTISG